MLRRLRFVGVVLMACGAPPAFAQTPLQKQLAAEDPLTLVQEARKLGDPARGAIHFYQAQLACARCHRIPSEGVGIGPDLTKRDKGVTDAYLIESILTPSKVIKKGFETTVITTKQGRFITGILADEGP